MRSCQVEGYGRQLTHHFDHFHLNSALLVFFHVYSAKIYSNFFTQTTWSSKLHGWREATVETRCEGRKLSFTLKARSSYLKRRRLKFRKTLSEWRATYEWEFMSRISLISCICYAGNEGEEKLWMFYQCLSSLLIFNGYNHCYSSVPFRWFHG